MDLTPASVIDVTLEASEVLALVGQMPSSFLYPSGFSYPGGLGMATADIGVLTIDPA